MDKELRQRIELSKKKLGRRLVILGHHYQRDDVIAFADFRGDSFRLSKVASEQKQAEFIVFCGVNFMAESARILARPLQRVFLPDMRAGCPMADMADLEDVENAWETLSKQTDIKKIIPVAYMNTTAEIKAFCGKKGGIICTSSNAPRVFKWAFERGDKIFFLPDEHLGRNTAKKLNIKGDEFALWGDNKIPKVILWPGFCHVHTFFTTEHIEEAREKYLGCKIVVHPECKEDVVNKSDDALSTEGICGFVARQKKGSVIIIGTEINLVGRLARENPDKKILPLARSLCPNMFKISLSNLCETLESIVKGEAINEVLVPKEITEPANKALSRMLTII